MGSRRFFARRSGNRDANHKAIADGLRRLGHHVIDLAGVGDGCPDLCVYARVDWRAPMSTETHLALLASGATPVWLELKVGKGKLRESQVAWRASAEARGVRVATVRTLDEALAVIGGGPLFWSKAPVWLELKEAKGKLRASQVAWRAAAEARGVRVATVRTLDEALAAIGGGA